MLSRFSTTTHPRAALIALLLALYLFVYVPVPDSLDGEALLAVAASISRTGSPNMNAIAYTDWTMPPSAGMGLIGVDGNIYSKKGIAPSLALIPFVIAADLLPPLTARAAAMLLNPLITAFTAALIYSAARRLGFSGRVSWWTGFLYGAATMALVYAGTLFGEPLAAFAVALAILSFARWCDASRPLDLLILGASFALLIAINLVYAALSPIALLFILLRHPSPSPASPASLASLASLAWRGGRGVRSLAVFALPIALTLIAIALLNLLRFGDPLENGYRFAEGEGFIHPLFLGLYGLFLSPYRGMFWYNPILFAALPGAYLLIRARAAAPVMLFALALAVGVALAFASWWSWYGGVVWGARFLIPALPAFALCLAPVIDRLFGATSRPRLLRWGFLLLVLLSMAVQLPGALISYIPHYAYLKENYFTGSFYGIVTSLSDVVLYDPRLSPILGHIELLLTGFPLQVGWLAHGFDPVYLLAAALLAAAALYFLHRSPPPLPDRSGDQDRAWRSTLLLLPILAALFLVAWRGSAAQPDAAAIQRLNDAIGGTPALIAATTYYGAGLLDLETRAHVVSLSAPVSPDDLRAARMVARAAAGGLDTAYLTWMPPADPADWIAHDLFTSAAIQGEMPLDGHRLLRFDQRELTADRPGGWRFGDIQLEGWGITDDGGSVRAVFSVSALQPLETDYTYFIHLIDAEGNILAQHDRAPRGGYAPTSGWNPGLPQLEKLSFPFDALPRPANQLSLRMGWIDPQTGERLPVTDPDGNSVSDGFALLPLHEAGE